MKSITVNLGPKSYDIHIGLRAIEKLALIKDISNPERPIFVITNRKINKLHGPKIRKALRKISKKIAFYQI
ncbi:MAG: hypothetical protein ABIH57_01135, partial [Candidatus Omnitrophota bacterium]